MTANETMRRSRSLGMILTPEEAASLSARTSATLLRACGQGTLQHLRVQYPNELGGLRRCDVGGVTRRPSRKRDKQRLSTTQSSTNEEPIDRTILGQSRSKQYVV